MAAFPYECECEFFIVQHGQGTNTNYVENF